jgi:ATP-dependent exoDNAse (exonuclease V) beta subunit
LSFPQLADEAMGFYTAITRARNQLYLIEANDYEDDEVESGPKGKQSRKKWTVKNKGSSLADYAFRKFAELSLTKAVQRVAEGQAEMTSAQHKVSAQREECCGVNS